MIRGTQVFLRTVREADLDTLFDLLSDIQNRGENIALNLPSEQAFKKEFRETSFWAEDRGRLLICATDGRTVGCITFARDVLYYDGLELGCILFDQARRNKGFATEAAQLLIRYLFATKKINRLQAAVIPQNTATKRLVQKCGFTFEGVARRAFFHNGAHHDVEIHSLLRSEVDLSRPVKKAAAPSRADAAIRGRRLA